LTFAMNQMGADPILDCRVARLVSATLSASFLCERDPPSVQIPAV
jgi:hypothetical protein